MISVTPGISQMSVSSACVPPLAWPPMATYVLPCVNSVSVPTGCGVRRLCQVSMLRYYHSYAGVAHLLAIVAGASEPGTVDGDVRWLHVRHAVKRLHVKSYRQDMSVWNANAHCGIRLDEIDDPQLDP